MPHITVVTMHGAITHFPIAMLVAAFAFEIASLLFRKKEWHVVGFWLLVTAVLGAIPSLITGWFTGNQFYRSIPHPPADFTQHRLMAFISSGIALLALILRMAIKDNPKGALATVSMILLILSTLVVSYTGYLGGEMVFGGGETANSSSDTRTTSENLPQNATSAIDPKLITLGKTLYQKNGCSDCHLMDGKGTSFGPNLSHEGLRNNSIDWQVKHLVNPTALKPGSSMPAYKQLPNDQLSALAAYLVSKH